MVAVSTRTRKLVKDHLDSWNVADPAQRRRLVEATSSTRAHVTSPYGEHSGASAQVESIAQVRAAFPKLRCRGRPLGEHHGWILVSWTTEFGGKRRPLRGIDVYQLNRRGRISRIVSFSPVSSL
jgi:hypothetical protein